MSYLPTFLFTDIEGSTRKWQTCGGAMDEALARHDSMTAEAVEGCSGRIVKHTGDGLMAVFENGRALECALTLQRVIGRADWSSVGGLRIRIGVHSGEASEKEGDFFGSDVSRTARLMSAGWGGQTVLSAEAAASESLPEGAKLRDEGVHMLRDLLNPQQLFTLSYPDIDMPHPPLATVSAHPHNLPVQPTPFVGRQRELREIGELLADPERRLVTLLGYGGSGKTRTALQTAAESVHLFRHGAWFVPLEEAEGQPSIISTMAESISYCFSGGGKEFEQLIGFLSNREILMVMDNFEHLTDHAHMVSDLLAGAPGLKVLVTSRHRLGIREESVYDLSGMRVPPENNDPSIGDSSSSPHWDLEDYDAVMLFLSSARRVLPDFSPEERDIPAIIDICCILGGMPLAIELAASWVRTISCVELQRELGRSRDILESTAGDLPVRQRSMRSVFEYSWNLLSDSEREALAGLSVFDGGFDRTAAEEVAGCGIRTMQRLCDRSLVRSGGGGRYSLHPMTREFVNEKQELCEGGSAGLLSRHCDHYHAFLREAQPRLQDSRQAETLGAISLELPNLRKGAMTAHRTLRLDRISEYTKIISHFLQVRSRLSEAVDLFRNLLSMAAGSTEDLRDDEKLMNSIEAKLKERISTFLLIAGRRREAASYLQEASALAGGMDDPMFSALCLAGLGNLAYLNEDWNGAEDYWSRSLETVRKEGTVKYSLSLMCNLASARKIRGEFAEARAILQEVGELNARSGDTYLNSSILSSLADISRMEGDLAGAEGQFRESLELSLGIGNLRGASYCLENIADIVSRRSPESSVEPAEESVRLALESGSVSRTVQARLRLAMIDSMNGLFEEAMGQLAEAEREVAILDSRKMEAKCAEFRSQVEAHRDRGAPGSG
ncbi:MAG: hypothetical protein JXA64_06985 [Candidatus Fermentibacteraceae bacterium]|nr:hypothetical protein [Candidatus Fermentibacteraceae bacterium]